MKRVLVTGASGFLGRHVLGPLLNHGFDVHAVNRTVCDYPQVTWHQADLLDPIQRRSVIARVAPSHLLHLAWCTDHAKFWSDPANLHWASATLDLAAAFGASGGTRMVVTGSCAEYDWRQAHEGPLHELASLRRPATLYGQAKLSTQELLSAYGRQTGISQSWAILFYLLGPYEKPQRLVPSVVTALLAGRRVALTPGTQVRDLLDIRDAGRALAILLDSSTEGRVNVASGKGIALKEACQRIGDVIGRPELLHFGELSMPPNEPSRLVADVTRLTTDVGFAPDYSLDDSIAATVAWWRLECPSGA